MANRNCIALCVDDDQLIVSAMAHILRELGFARVQTAQRLDAAQSLIKQETFDFAVLDYSLGQDGVSTELALTLANRGVEVVIFSGYDQTEVDSRLSTFAFLQKPLIRPALEAHVRRVLDPT